MSKQEQKEFESRKPERTAYGFFDIDGTLTEGFTIVSFAEFLAKAGIFSQFSWQKMRQDLETYGGSGKDDDAYRKFAIDLVNHYARGLAGRGVDEINLQSENFFEETLAGRIRGYKILPFSKNLVNKLGSQAVTIAISGSPLESLGPLKNYLGFDELWATIVEIKNGVYTGEVLLNLAIDSAKRKVISEYLERGVDTKNSFAFGDSPHDLPLLEAVGNPYVLGRNVVLGQIAHERGYELFLHGEGIVENVGKKLKNE